MKWEMCHGRKMLGGSHVRTKRHLEKHEMEEGGPAGYIQWEKEARWETCSGRKRPIWRHLMRR